MFWGVWIEWGDRITFSTEAGKNLTIPSIEAFCLRMLHKKYFNVSNRWYAPDFE